MRVRTLALCAAAMLVAAPAFAQQNQPITFRYSSFELETDGGTNAVYQRIARTADTLCGATSTRTAIWQRASQKKCAAEIAGQFVQKIGDQKLIALHAASTDQNYRVGEN